MSLQNKIISYVLLAISLVLGFFLVNNIKFAIEEEERIAASEEEVKNKLMLIRDAEIAYQSVKGKYTSNWDSLAKFVESDIFYITQKTEQIISLSYGADSVIVHIDTLGTKPVLDSLFKDPIFATYDFSNLKYIPNTENLAFDIFTEKIEKGGVIVDVIEVKDVAPVNPNRKEDSDIRNRKPLRFGSRTDITTSGNWE